MFNVHVAFVLVAWRSGSIVRHTNWVALHRVRLVLGWVTVIGRVHHLSLHLANWVNSALHPSRIAKLSTGLAGVKVAMSPLLGSILCGLQGVMCPWFDFRFLCYMYCLLVYIICFPHLSFYPNFFLIYLFPLRTDPLHFQAGCRKWWLKWLKFFVFILWRSSFSWSVNACFCCVSSSFFPHERLVGETSPKWRILCRVGRKTTARSIGQLLGCDWLQGRHTKTGQLAAIKVMKVNEVRTWRLSIDILFATLCHTVTFFAF